MTTETKQQDVTLSWTVTESYQRSFSPEMWTEFVSTLDGSLDPNDLDAVYTRLERGDWVAEEFLASSAASKWWVDTHSAEVTDLEYATD